MNRRDFLVAAAAAPVALAAARGALAGRSSGRALALVTADTEQHVAAVDLGTGRVLRRLATLPGPRSIESAGGRVALVAHTSEGAVTLLDSRPLRVRRVLRGFAEPRYTASSADGRRAYVTDSANGELVTVDVVRGRVVHRLDVAGPARHLSLEHGGRRLWLALGSKAPALAVVDLSDPARPRLARRVRPPFLAHDVGFVPGTPRIWVTSGDRGTIALYDPRSDRIVARLPGDAPPQHVTFAAGLAFVTSGDDAKVRVHSLDDGRVLRTTRVPVGSYNVQQGGGRIVTPSLERGTLCVLDRHGGLLVRVRVAPSSHDACVVVA